MWPWQALNYLYLLSAHRFECHLKDLVGKCHGCGAGRTLLLNNHREHVYLIFFPVHLIDISPGQSHAISLEFTKEEICFSSFPSHHGVISITEFLSSSWIPLKYIWSSLFLDKGSNLNGISMKSGGSGAALKWIQHTCCSLSFSWQRKSPLCELTSKRHDRDRKSLHAQIRKF